MVGPPVRQRGQLTVYAARRYDASSVCTSTASTRRWVLSGRVQGVGFRWFVLRAAQRLALDGTVCNLPAGQVEVVARGSDEQLDGLDTALRQGPPAARVGDVQVGSARLPVEHDGFQITY